MSCDNKQDIDEVKDGDELDELEIQDMIDGIEQMVNAIKDEDNKKNIVRILLNDITLLYHTSKIDTKINLTKEQKNQLSNSFLKLTGNHLF
jgi:hypothetical protein